MGTHTMDMETAQTTTTPYTSAAPATSRRGFSAATAGLMCFAMAATFLAGRHSVHYEQNTAAYKFMPAAKTSASRTRMHVEADAVEPPPPPPPPPFDLTKQAGVIAPTGFFDPLGLSKDKSEARLRYFQEAETKHGRVAMLAALGFLVGENFHPLFGGNVDTPSYVAFQQTPLQTFWPAVVALLAYIENGAIGKFKNPDGQSLWQLKDDHEIGDLSFDPANFKPKDATALKNMKTKELQNGRLAMLGIAGMVAQELVDGKKIFGAAPASAQEILDVAHEMQKVLSQ